MVDQKIDEHYLFLSSNPIHFSTNIGCIDWSDVLGGCMGNHFLRGGVGVHLTIAIIISGIVGVDTYFIVVARGMEAKPAD